MKTKQSIKNLKEFSFANSIILCCSNNTSWKVISLQAFSSDIVHRHGFSIWFSLPPSSGLLRRVSVVEWVSSCSSVSFVFHPCCCADVPFAILCCMYMSMALLSSLSLLHFVSWCRYAARDCASYLWLCHRIVLSLSFVSLVVSRILSRSVCLQFLLDRLIILFILNF